MNHFLYPGDHEPLKAFAHGMVLCTSSLCLVYNVAAWTARKEPHLAVNAVVYSSLVCFEVSQVLHHLQRGSR